MKFPPGSSRYGYCIAEDKKNDREKKGEEGGGKRERKSIRRPVGRRRARKN
jgi:hypothetical protein